MAEQSHKTFLCLILVIRKHAERQNGKAAIIPGAKLGSIRDFPQSYRVDCPQIVFGQYKILILCASSGREPGDFRGQNLEGTVQMLNK